MSDLFDAAGYVPCPCCGGSGRVMPSDGHVRLPEPLPPLDRNAEGGAKRNAPVTSKLAALDVFPRSGTQRRRVFEYVAEAGGATASEAADATGIAYVSTSARMSELAKGGWVENSGTMRETRLRSEAFVFVATDQALREWTTQRTGGSA